VRTGRLVEASTYYPNGARETYVADSAAAAEPRGFTSKEGDEEVGLVYFGERYLVPRVGRWATPDPLHVHQVGGGEALNSYHYVAGNLLSALDPLGLHGRNTLRNVHTTEQPGNRHVDIPDISGLQISFDSRLAMVAEGPGGASIVRGNQTVVRASGAGLGRGEVRIHQFTRSRGFEIDGSGLHGFRGGFGTVGGRVIRWESDSWSGWQPDNSSTDTSTEYLGFHSHDSSGSAIYDQPDMAEVGAGRLRRNPARSSVLIVNQFVSVIERNGAPVAAVMWRAMTHVERIGPDWNQELQAGQSIVEQRNGERFLVTRQVEYDGYRDLSGAEPGVPANTAAPEEVSPGSETASSGGE